MRDGAVSLSDVTSVLVFVGATLGGPPNGHGVQYGVDADGTGVADGAQYDRTPSTTAGKLWRSNAPDGAVSLQDVAVVLAQVGDRC